MKNLEAALSEKALSDLVATKAAPATTLLTPTVGEIETILSHMKEGKDYKWIKKNVRRVITEGDRQISAKGFSVGQIKEIDEARRAKISELTPAPVKGDVLVPMGK